MTAVEEYRRERCNDLANAANPEFEQGRSYLRYFADKAIAELKQRVAELEAERDEWKMAAKLWRRDALQYLSDADVVTIEAARHSAEAELERLRAAREGTDP